MIYNISFYKHISSPLFSSYFLYGYHWPHFQDHIQIRYTRPISHVPTQENISFNCTAKIREVEWLRLEGTSGHYLTPSPFNSSISYSKLSRAMSGWASTVSEVARSTNQPCSSAVSIDFSQNYSCLITFRNWPFKSNAVFPHNHKQQ